MSSIPSSTVPAHAPLGEQAGPIGIACDHGGFQLKSLVVTALEAAGLTVKDFGAHSLDESDDYPDFVIPLAHAVASGDVSRGIAICGSGVGACIVANKLPGVRACVVHDEYSAHQGVEHDALNLLCLGGRIIGSAVALEIVSAYLKAQFTGEDRHVRRLSKLSALEAEAFKTPVPSSPPA